MRKPHRTGEQSRDAKAKRRTTRLLLGFLRQKGKTRLAERVEERVGR